MEGLAIGIIVLLVVTIVVLLTMLYHQSNHILVLQEYQHYEEWLLRM